MVIPNMKEHLDFEAPMSERGYRAHEKQHPSYLALMELLLHLPECEGKIPCPREGCDKMFVMGNAYALGIQQN